MSKKPSSPLARRSFLTQVSTGVTVLGAAGVVAAPAGAQSAANTRWEPTRHKEDDWLDQIPGKHRFLFDTTTPDGMGSAMQFATNYYLANASGYGLQNGDLAVVVVARHLSTASAYNEAIWTKYGVPISNFIDRTKEPVKTNPHARQLAGLLGRGAHLAVCQMATRALAGSVARSMNMTQDEVYNEIAANLLPNSHLVPAGIVAVNRAQERGYAFVYGV